MQVCGEQINTKEKKRGNKDEGVHGDSRMEVEEVKRSKWKSVNP